MQILFGLLMFIASVFLILLVLVQRGRGGGLSGAFGGMGGQSAFGAKAGDTFTKITVVSATVWILLCMLATGMLGGKPAEKSVFSTDAGTVINDIAGDEGNSDLDLGVPPSPEGGEGAGLPGLDLGGPDAGDATTPADATAPATTETAPATEVPAAEITTDAEAVVPAGE